MKRGCGQPPREAAVGVSAGISGEVDEELVAAEQVAQVRAGRYRLQPAAGFVTAGQAQPAFAHDVDEPELVEQVVIGVGASVEFVGAESGDRL